MNLLEGGKGGWEREDGEGTEGGWGGDVGERGRGCGGEREGGREGREGGMTVNSVIHILTGMFNSNPMIPQYLNNNLT